jgi:hypothetical protein
LSWRVVAASEAGTSHLARGRACEDRCRARVDVTRFGTPVLSILVADGAGSVPHAAEGAELAVQAAATVLAARIERAELALDESVAQELLAAMRSRIAQVAEERGEPVRTFACTFVGVLSTPETTLVMQIGDGGAVVDVGNGLELAITPMEGEYANSTRFVIDDDAAEYLATCRYPHAVMRAAVFSDGIQRLALDFATGRPHAPLFERLFDVTASAPSGREEELHAALVRFLNSPDVNERTDDDKTLALAVRTAQ